MTIALGTRAHAKHVEKCKAAEAYGESVPKFVNVRVIQTATAATVTELVAIAVVYHGTVVPQGGVT